MASRIRLDVITPVKGPTPALTLTAASLALFAKDPLVDLRWIVLESPSEDGQRFDWDALPMVDRRNHHVGLWSQYEAINAGLEFVTADFFVILNDGDTLTHDGVKRVLACFRNTERVICGQTAWHDKTGAPARYKSRSIRPSLAIMPNHQAMLFPKALRSEKYREDLPIAADQDLKLRLWSRQLLMVVDDQLASSLIGGRSMGKLRARDVAGRYTETREVLTNHMPRLKAETLGLGYGLRYLGRVLSRDS